MERQTKLPISPRRDKDESIPYAYLNPHYSDERFNRQGNMTVFLSEGNDIQLEYGGAISVKGANYEYADEAKREASKRASEKALEIVGNTNSAKYIEEYLRNLHDQPKLELVHIVTGLNSLGYPYRIYGYTIPEEASLNK